jgi:hypothetical protein
MKERKNNYLTKEYCLDMISKYTRKELREKYKSIYKKKKKNMTKELEQELATIPKMTDQELTALETKLTTCEDLPIIHLHIIDEVYDYEEDEEDDALINGNVLRVCRFITKHIQVAICEKSSEKEFKDLSNQCKVDVVKQIIPDDEECDGFKSHMVDIFEKNALKDGLKKVNAIIDSKTETKELPPASE